MDRTIQAALFDLDGVLVDTAKYHYLAWKRLAQELGFFFSKKQNERLKGVSRMRSLEILLEEGNLSGEFSQEEMLDMASRKNAWYVEYIENLKRSELFPGARECLTYLRGRGIRTALGSASKNSGLILERLEITDLFDAIVDGNMVSRAKPDPEVFERGAQLLQVPYESCVVFEDSQAGLEAGRAAGMYTVAIGTSENLAGYDELLSGVSAYKELKILQK